MREGYTRRTDLAPALEASESLRLLPAPTACLLAAPGQLGAAEIPFTTVQGHRGQKQGNQGQK